MTERTATQLAYDRVIAHVRAKYREDTGSEYGSMVWLAGQLGISRQVLELWGKRDGIPAEYVKPIAQITGLKKKDIRPDMLAVKIPREAWSVICKHSPKEAIDQAVVGEVTRWYWKS